MSGEDDVVIVYIAGLGHSGSTLLDLLLSSHSRITSGGELKALSARFMEFTQKKFRRKNLERRKKLAVPDSMIGEGCSCGAPALTQCPFWTRVDERLRADHGLALSALDTCADDPVTFVRDNHALFQAIRAVSGRRWIVDSSKNLERLEALLACGRFDVRAIYLERDPLAIVHSNVKRKRSLYVHACRINNVTMRCRAFLKNRPHYALRYERLAARPGEALADVMRWLGLPYEESQLNWTAREHHNIHGNEMRFLRESRISPDESWRTGLSPIQKWCAGALTLPNRCHAPWLFKCFPGGGLLTPLRNRLNYTRRKWTAKWS